jgi:hypothetical protein
VKQAEKLVWWPSPQDYNEAVQNARLNVSDAELKQSTVEINAMGLPKAVSGAFASVYKMKCAQRSLALRCFLQSSTDQEARYAIISSFVENDALPYTVTFAFMHEAVRINARWFPALKMEWVEGVTLDAYVRENLTRPDRLAALADSFQVMCAELAAAGVAHGDLQHGNILVKDGELRLVDYDGMFVPGMEGMYASELGHRNYQHPQRNEKFFGAQLDYFSAWVIHTSLKCLAIDPALFKTLAAGDECLLFRQADFQNPEASYAFATLESHSDPDVQRYARYLRRLLHTSISEVPPLSNDVPGAGELPDVVAEAPTHILQSREPGDAGLTRADAIRRKVAREIPSLSTLQMSRKQPPSPCATKPLPAKDLVIKAVVYYLVLVAFNPFAWWLIAMAVIFHQWSGYLWLCGICALACVILCLADLNHSLLHRAGLRASGKIVSIEEKLSLPHEQNLQSSVYALISYSFLTQDGRRIPATKRASADAMLHFRKGSQLTIFYDPKDPGRHVIGELPDAW